MTLIGPVVLKLAGQSTDYGDFVTQIQRTTPQPVTIAAINRDHSDVPSRGHALTLTGVEKTLKVGSLWRLLHDHAGEKDVPIEWATTSEGVSWEGVIAVVPDPSQGGQANQHGTFNISIPLVSRPTLVDVTADEWTLTISGSPAGGTYTLIVNGFSTAPIAHNANAAAVAAALNALSGVTSLGTITATGTPIVITFPEAVSLAVTHALTGGTDPDAVVAA